MVDFASIKDYDPIAHIMDNQMDILSHHCCSDCHFFNFYSLHICIVSGNVHDCTPQSCELAYELDNHRICQLTGKRYEQFDRIQNSYVSDDDAGGGSYNPQFSYQPENQSLNLETLDYRSRNMIKNSNSFLRKFERRKQKRQKKDNQNQTNPEDNVEQVTESSNVCSNTELVPFIDHHYEVQQQETDQLYPEQVIPITASKAKRQQRIADAKSTELSDIDIRIARKTTTNVIHACLILEDNENWTAEEIATIESISVRIFDVYDDIIHSEFFAGVKKRYKYMIHILCSLFDMIDGSDIYAKQDLVRNKLRFKQDLIKHLNKINCNSFAFTARNKLTGLLAAFELNQRKSKVTGEAAARFVLMSKDITDGQCILHQHNTSS